MEKTAFGTGEGGARPYLYTFRNKNGMEITVSDFGAVLKSAAVPDRFGHMRDIVLGYGSLKDYEKNTNTYFGATVGRSANRIAGASFTLGGKKYSLAPNEGGNNLHSGPDGYQIRMWDVREVDEGHNKITFALSSPDGDQGFPGNLDISVTYMLTDDNEICITYRGLCDKDTVFNPTNHSYFNLGGHGSGTILSHLLTLYADFYTPVGPSLIPVGEIAKVEGTPLDFRSKKAIGADIGADFDQLHFVGGYDHNFVLDRDVKGVRLAAEAQCPESGISMEVYTDRPGIQLYSGNFLKDEPGKDGATYVRRGGFCLETQCFPNAVNTPGFGSPIIKAGEEVFTRTVYKFKSEGLKEKD